MSLRLECPEALSGIVPLLVLLWVMWRGRKHRGTFSLRRFFLVAVGFVSCILGLARPQGGHYATTQRGMQGDLYLAVDISNSMRAEDLSPSRLEFASAFLNRLLGQVPGLRVAIFPFAADGYLQMPLSRDQGAASELIGSLTPSATTNQGTDFQASLTTLIAAIDKATATQQGENSPTRVLLLSDGESHQELSKSLLDKFRAHHIPIDTVGTATAEGGYIPIEVSGGFGHENQKDSNGKPVVSRLETKLLRQISEGTGGNYYSARLEETERIADRILQGMEFGKLSTQFKLEHEYFPTLFLVALAAFGLEFLFGRWQFFIRAIAVAFLFHASPLSVFAWDAEIEEKLKDAGKNRPYTAYNEARRLFDEGRLNDAAELFQESISSFAGPNLKKKALYDLGNTLMRLQDPVQALSAYQRAYDTQVNNAEEQKSLNDDISQNMLLAKRLKQKQEQEQKDQKEGDGEGDKTQQPKDPGKSKQFKGQSFDEAQKQKMFDATKAEEQQALQRLQNRNRQTTDPKGKPW